jgi:CRISPR-associated protein Cmr3
MSKYLVTLKPLTPYFFGGEKTFEDGNVNYYVRSNYLPQQTTILGMLRYELLLQNELIGTDPKTKDWHSLIGTHSFGKQDGKFVNEFGAIKNISPVFITNKKNYFTTQSLDWAYYDFDDGEKINGFSVKKKRIAPISFNIDHVTAGIAIYDQQALGVPKVSVGKSPYNPKCGLVSLWVSSDGKILKQWDYCKPDKFNVKGGFENGLFVKHEQIGIHRNLNRRREEKGDFYKQVSYKLVEDYCFAFFIDLELPHGKVFKSRMITMGGERSFFDMSVEDPCSLSFETIFDANTFSQGNSRIHKAFVLTSDCYCEDSIINNCLYSVSDTINFQNIFTHQSGGINYAQFVKGSLNKSGEDLSLLKRGSVLFPQSDNTDKVRNALTNSAFAIIGYNKFIEIN